MCLVLTDILSKHQNRWLAVVVLAVEKLLKLNYRVFQLAVLYQINRT